MMSYSRHMLGLLLLLSLFSPGLLLAQAQDNYPFADADKQQQFNQLLKRVRCLVCQNQDISDSNAHLAQDLRQKIYDKVQAGETDADIVDYLLARYGEFILFEPRLQAMTYVLWFGPFLLLGIGFMLFWRCIRRPA